MGGGMGLLGRGNNAMWIWWEMKSPAGGGNRKWLNSLLLDLELSFANRFHEWKLKLINCFFFVLRSYHFSEHTYSSAFPSLVKIFFIQSSLSMNSITRCKDLHHVSISTMRSSWPVLSNVKFSYSESKCSTPKFTFASILEVWMARALWQPAANLLIYKLSDHVSPLWRKILRTYVDSLSYAYVDAVVSL